MVGGSEELRGGIFARPELRAHVVVLRSTPRFPMRSKSSTASFHLRGGAHAAIITL